MIRINILWKGERHDERDIGYYILCSHVLFDLLHCRVSQHNRSGISGSDSYAGAYFASGY